MGKIIGIDLGTTNSCVAFLEGGKPTVIPNFEGDRTTPSVVGFTKDGERIVGVTAKNQAVSNPERTVISIKREMGSDYKVKIDGKQYSPQEISAMILAKLKADAEAYTHETITQAVITVPAYFTDAQRQATKDAGRIAGLEVLRIINEPTAAALAYGLDKGDLMNGNKASQKVFVYDLGGGTFDISILDIGDGLIEVVATAGNNRLGGDDFDQKIIEYMVAQFKAENGIDLLKDLSDKELPTVKQRLKATAEDAKKKLSNAQSTHINIPFIMMGSSGPLHLDCDLTRAKFNAMIEPLIEQTIRLTKQAMADASYSVADIDKILLVGGSTRIPAVVEAIKNFSGKEPFKDVNPDECVACGAAIQGGVLGGEVKDILLRDVTPLSLGIETMGGVFTRLIDRNTSIPTRKSEVFSTASDNQPAVDIHVLQGERSMAADNKTLGRFELTGIPPAPRGIPQIEVTFDIDTNGIVQVSAKDKGTGKEQKITITSTKLSEEQIQAAVKEAEKFAEEDAKRRKLIDTRNEAEGKAINMEKALKESGDKLDAADKQKVEDVCKKLRDAMSSEDADVIRAAIEEADKNGAEVFAKLYQQMNNNANGDAANGGDNIVVDDAEIVDDDKK